MTTDVELRAGSTGLRSTSAEAELPKTPKNGVRHFLARLGPGLITGASDDDPSGIGTYASAGALLGYGGLWTALVTYPLMASVQFICAKIGLVTGNGLAGVLKRHYPKALLYPVVLGLVVANTINAGADIGAIAAGINLLVPSLGIKAMILPLGLLLLAMQIWCSYRVIARIFKWLTLSLFAYVGAAFLAKPDWWAVLRGTVVPSVHPTAGYLSILVAILGTTISPYLFFWQADCEVEEHRNERSRVTPAKLRAASVDVNVGMLLSNMIMFFIILATAATLHVAGKTEVNTAADAAAALKPFAGPAAELLMALGLVGTGLLGVPILTASAAYAASQAMGWRYGLSRRPARAKSFYLVLAASTILGLAINYVGISSVDALLWTAVLNGLLAPPLLVVIMLVSNNRKVMGEHVNGRVLNVLGWIATVVMFAAAVGFGLTWKH